MRPAISPPDDRFRTSRVLAAWLICWISAGSWTPATAEVIGRAQEVRSEVLAIESGKPQRQLKRNDSLQRGLRVRLTRRESYLVVYLFGIGVRPPIEGPQDIRIGKYRIEGVVHLAGQVRLDTGNENDPLTSRVEVEPGWWGSLRAFLAPGRTHEIEGNTPQAALGFKGTAVRVLVDPLIGTFVAVDEGIATVQAVAGGDPVEVRSGQWVLVPPGGLPTRPAPLDGVDILDDPPLLGCCDFRTDPPEGLLP